MSSHTTGTLARSLGAELRGPADIAITGPATMDVAGPQHITFVRSEEYAKQWPKARAGAVLVSRALAIDEVAGRALLVVADADLALIEVIRIFEPPAIPTPPGVHASAVVDAGARVDPTAHVGPLCVIGAGAVVGAGAVLHAGAVVGALATIGPGTIVHARAVVMERCSVGAGCILHPGCVIGADGFGFRPSPDGRTVIKIPHAGNVEIHDGVEIGANTCVDRGKFGPTVIGAGTKIDNLVQIAHNVRIGRSCLIAGNTGVAGSVKIGDGVLIGGGASVRDNIEIGSGARIAATAGVMRDVEPGESVAGNPAAPSREIFRQLVALRRLSQRAPRAPQS